MTDNENTELHKHVEDLLYRVAYLQVLVEGLLAREEPHIRDGLKDEASKVATITFQFFGDPSEVPPQDETESS